MAPVVLGYWKFRGLGQHIRLLLEYTEADYTDKHYDHHHLVTICPTVEKAKENNCSDPSCWMSEKLNLGLTFPNLPYYIDSDAGINITQSNAIMRHIGRKHGLCGNTEQEQARVDMIENELMDLRIYGWCKMIFSSPEEFEEVKAEYLKNLEVSLKQLSDFLGNRTWFAGDKITYADFIIYEFLDVNRVLKTDCLEQHKNLQDFTVRFEQLPAIEKYMKSGSFIASPINGVTARFSNK